jgi:tetratricopeptide (TPR) repeat protein
MSRSGVRDDEEAIRLKPTLEIVWNGRSWTRAIVGELPAALTDCNEALRLKPDVAATFSRGLTYLKIGQWESAIDDYSSALRLDPTLASHSMDADLPSSRRATQPAAMPISRRHRQSSRISAGTSRAMGCSEAERLQSAIEFLELLYR